MEKRKPGRPAKPEAERFKDFTVRLNPEDRQRMEAAAARLGMAPYRFIRCAVIRMSNDTLD